MGIVQKEMQIHPQLGVLLAGEWKWSTLTTGFGCNSTMQSQDDNLTNKRIMC